MFQALRNLRYMWLSHDAWSAKLNTGAQPESLDFHCFPEHDSVDAVFWCLMLSVRNGAHAHGANDYVPRTRSLVLAMLWAAVKGPKR